MSSTQNNVKLRRELGLFSAVCLIISVMLGECSVSNKKKKQNNFIFSTFVLDIVVVKTVPRYPKNHK